MNKFFIVLLVTLCLIMTSLLAKEEEKKSDVVVLDLKNYDKVLKENKYVLVEFYAPWCGHCKNLAPEYEKVATHFKDNKDVVVAKVDADKHRELGTKAGVKGFPTLKLYKDEGKNNVAYNSGRTAQHIIRWLSKKTGPVAVTAASQADIDAFVKKNEGKALIGFFENKESAAYKTYIKLCDSDKTFGDFPAVEVFNADLVKAAGKDTLKLIVPSKKEAVTFSGDIAKDAKSWLLGNGYPLVEEIGAENFQRYVDSGLKLAVAFINKKDEKEKKKTLELLEKVAESVKGKLSWGWSDGVLYKDQIKAMGADPTKLPAYAAMDIQKRLNYPYAGDKTVEDLTKWSTGVAEGTVQPFLKSAEIPKEQKEAVIVVVGKSFKDIVYDKTKDVLVEFYAPWCGHCKSLAPKYLKLAEKLKSNKNLIIAKVDATENDTPITVEGFPTIYYFPSDNKEKPIQYGGARTIEGMEKFLREKAVASKDSFPAETKEEPKKTEEAKKDKKDEL